MFIPHEKHTHYHINYLVMCCHPHHILATMPFSTSPPGVDHFQQMAPTQVLTGLSPAQPFWKYVMENNRHTKEQKYFPSSPEEGLEMVFCYQNCSDLL